jgi:dGTPase
MDLSDDIAYSVHDFEDAVVGGYIDVRALDSRVDHDELVDSMFEWIGGEFEKSELIAAFDRLDSLNVWLAEWDGSRRAQARLKNLTSQLIGRFAAAATKATMATATMAFALVGGAPSAVGSKPAPGSVALVLPRAPSPSRPGDVVRLSVTVGPGVISAERDVRLDAPAH